MPVWVKRDFSCVQGSLSAEHSIAESPSGVIPSPLSATVMRPLPISTKASIEVAMLSTPESVKLAVRSEYSFAEVPDRLRILSGLQQQPLVGSHHSLANAGSP